MDDTSTVTLKLYAAYREALGKSEIVMTVTGKTTVGNLLDGLVSAHPQLERWIPVTRFAVNETFVTAQHLLQSGDEVVFIPPVSGG